MAANRVLATAVALSLLAACSGGSAVNTAVETTVPTSTASTTTAVSEVSAAPTQPSVVDTAPSQSPTSNLQLLLENSRASWPQILSQSEWPDELAVGPFIADGAVYGIIWVTAGDYDADSTWSLFRFDRRWLKVSDFLTPGTSVGPGNLRIRLVEGVPHEQVFIVFEWCCPANYPLWSGPFASVGLIKSDGVYDLFLGPMSYMSPEGWVLEESPEDFVVNFNEPMKIQFDPVNPDVVLTTLEGSNWPGWSYWDVPALRSPEMLGSGCESDGRLPTVIADGIYHVEVRSVESEIVTFESRCVYTGVEGQRRYERNCPTDECYISTPEFSFDEMSCPSSLDATCESRTLPIWRGAPVGVHRAGYAPDGFNVAPNAYLPEGYYGHAWIQVEDQTITAMVFNPIGILGS